MKITRLKANKFEGIGLILILLSFFVQMIETDIENDIKEQENFNIQNKIDYLWTVMSDDYSNRYPEHEVHMAIDFKYFVDDYKIYTQNQQQLSGWKKLVKHNWFTNTRLSLFILGSIILIIPKFLNIKE